MLGTRGIWEEGWKAAALHAPISGAGHFDQDRWELYHVDEDRSESKNLSKENPEKLKELIDVWFKEADKNFVLPLDDRSAVELLAHRASAVRAAADALHLLPGYLAGARVGRRQHPRPVVQDRRRRRHHADSTA